MPTTEGSLLAMLQDIRQRSDSVIEAEIVVGENEKQIHLSPA